LDAVDVVRLLTVALVITVHVVAQQPGGIGLANGVVLTVMHTSREVFFLLTAFVLVYSYRDRAPSRWSAFWRRRYPLVGVPYLVWSAVYFVADGERLWPGGHALRTFTGMVMDGTARYHLYFLLVSMQLYLVFPLLRRLLQATTRWHGWLLAGAGVYQVGFYAAIQQRWTLGPLMLSQHDPNPYLTSYLGFILAGGVVACHAQKFIRWTSDRMRWIFIGCAVTVVIGIGVFFVQVWQFGQAPVTASDVFQPVVVVESVAIAWTFLALGLAWQHRGMPGRRMVRAVSDASFGVYLAHPLLLQGVLALSAATGLTAFAARLTSPLVTAVAMVVVVPLIYLICALVAAATRSTPLSLVMTGRSSRGGGPRTRPDLSQRPGGQPGPVPTPVPTSPGGKRCERQPA
jgi:peptidoglycan/LPS O-acetylase OafA/YrhL